MNCIYCGNKLHEAVINTRVFKQFGLNYSIKNSFKQHFMLLKNTSFRSSYILKNRDYSSFAVEKHGFFCFNCFKLFTNNIPIKNKNKNKQIYGINIRVPIKYDKSSKSKSTRLKTNKYPKISR